MTTTTGHPHAPRLRLALFDIDGTLVCSRDHIGAAAFRAGIKGGFGFRGSPEEVPHTGFTDHQTLSALARFHGLDEARIASALPMVFHIKDARLLTAVGSDPGAHPLDPCIGAIDLVRALKAAGVVLGLVTGNTKVAARLKLIRSGFTASDFQVGGYGDQPGPRVGLVRTALAQASSFLPSLTPDQVVVIGDTPPDVASGRDAGCRTLAVSSGRATVTELSQTDPGRLVSSLAPARPLMTWLLGRRS